MGTAALLATTGSVGAAEPDPGTALRDFWTRIPAFLERYPSLPGVALLNDWIGAAPTNVTPDQERLLRGALVLQAEQLLRMGGGTIKVQQFEDAMQRGLAPDLPSKGYLESLLTGVEQRVVEDRDFAARVADAADRADALDGTSPLAKRRRLSWPEIGAIVMAVVIIVIIILI
jgi:hypothetical protein